MSETFSFRFQRADWVALSTAVARRPLPLRLAIVVAVLSFLVMVMNFVDAGDGSGRTVLAAVLDGGPTWYPWYAFGVLLALGLFFRHRIVGFTAAMGFARMPLADKELKVEMGASDVHVASGDFDWRFPWEAVGRVVETPTHLVLATGGREGLPIPRAAFADASAFEKVRAFVLARLVQGAVHERV
jgi:hypothetical protein